MIGEKIKNLRKEKKLTQKFVASEAGISSSYLQQLELGSKENPSIEVLNRIAKALNISVEELLSNSDDSFSFKLLSSIEKLLCKNEDSSKHHALNNIVSRLSIFNISAEPLYDLVKNSALELPTEIQLKLLDYLFELDYTVFFNFCEDNKAFITSNSLLNEFVTQCYALKIHDLETTSFLAFKKYLLATFNEKIEECDKHDLMELHEEVNKFLEFALFKLENRNHEK